MSSHCSRPSSCFAAAAVVVVVVVVVAMLVAGPEAAAFAPEFVVDDDFAAGASVPQGVCELVTMQRTMQLS